MIPNQAVSPSTLWLIIGGLAFIVLIQLAIQIIYLLDIRDALKQCSPKNRKIAPNDIWWTLLPVVGLFVHYYMVTRVPQSLGAEMLERGLQTKTRPGFFWGLTYTTFGIIANTAMAISWDESMSFGEPLAITALALGAVATICWLIFWSIVNEHKNKFSKSV